MLCLRKCRVDAPDCAILPYMPGDVNHPEEGIDEAALEEWLASAGETPRDEWPRRRVGGLAIAAIVLAIVTIIGMVLLRPTGEARKQAEALSVLGTPSEFYTADVVDITRGPCPGIPDATCSDATFELTAGPHTGSVITQIFPEGGTSPTMSVGQTVILSYVPANALVVDAVVAPCDFDPEQDCRTLTLTIETSEGPTQLDHTLFPGDFGADLAVGDEAVVDFFEDQSGEFDILGVSPVDLERQYNFSDIQRRGMLLWLALAFAVVVVALGGLRGAAALFGLVASLLVLLLFVLPAILDGRSPVLVAVFGSAAIAYLALYLAHGFTRMTTVALIGTLVTLALTAVLSAVVVGLADFTGLASEESTLLTLFEGIDVSGLLLAGVVLGAAGAIDDVTVTQASAVWELKAANPRLGASELFRSGLRIGRDHIASMVNTLLLAYAGAALPLLVLFVLSEQSLGTVANNEVVAVEIVRTLVGSIGLIGAVPLTTWLASVTAHGPRTEVSPR